MSNPTKYKRRRGHTLVELMAAMVSGSILLAGLGSVMLIGRQIAYTPTASAKQLDAAQVGDSIADELRFATFVVTHTSNLIEFVVADRDGDGAAERFRYEWSGVAGAPLQKTVNGGTAFNVLASVQNFQCSWQTEAITTAVTTTVDTAEAILVSNASSPSNTERDINSLAFSAQRLNPTAFSNAAPAGATCWNVTKVDFYADDANNGTTLRVQIRSAGDPSDSPTSHLLGEVAIPEANLSSNRAWNTAIFTSPVRGLALHRNYDLVWTGTTVDSGNAAGLVTDDNAATGVNESNDAGVSWSFMPNRQTYYRLYGTYSKPGTTYNVIRNYATHVTLVLQTGSTTQSRINASIPLVNSPELLTAYWRTDFDANPTTADVTRDGTTDWIVPSNGTFNAATLSGGLWQPAGALETRPLNNFTNITTVDVRCRNTSVGGNGAVVQINADRQGGVYAPVFVRLQRQSDGTQTLTLFGKSDASTNVTLFQRKRLPSGFVRFRLTILPQNNVVNLRLNEEDQGTFVYNTFAPPANDGYTTIYTDTSTSEFDYVEVRVAEN